VNITEHIKIIINIHVMTLLKSPSSSCWCKLLIREDIKRHTWSSICRRGLLLRSVAPELMSYKIACALRPYFLLRTLSVRLNSDLTLSPFVLCAMTVQDITATLKIYCMAFSTCYAIHVQLKSKWFWQMLS